MKRKDISFSWTERLEAVKIVIIPKAIHRICAIIIFLKKIYLKKIILKFIENGKGTKKQTNKQTKNLEIEEQRWRTHIYFLVSKFTTKL